MYVLISKSPARFSRQAALPTRRTYENKAIGEEAAARLKREGGDVRYLAIDLTDPATIAAAANRI